MGSDKIVVRVSQGCCDTVRLKEAVWTKRISRLFVKVSRSSIFLVMILSSAIFSWSVLRCIGSSVCLEVYNSYFK